MKKRRPACVESDKLLCPPGPGGPFHFCSGIFEFFLTFEKEIYKQAQKIRKSGHKESLNRDTPPVSLR